MRVEKININGEDLEVKESTMRVILPLLESKTTNLGIELAKLSVFDSTGEKIGDSILDFGFNDFQNILEVVNRVHGLNEEKKS